MIKKDIKTKIKEYFIQNPTKKLRVRQIEKTLSLPIPSVIRYTKELTEEKILKINRIENIKFYQADRTSENFILEKKIFNIKQLTKLIKHLKKEYSNPTIILFGSYAKGEDIEASDIDLFIQTPITKVEIPEKIEKELERSIQIFAHKNIQEIKNKELANNIINGIVLNGFLEVFK